MRHAREAANSQRRGDERSTTLHQKSPPSGETLFQGKAWTN
jgi:hypothetical protein